jgi:hypothetical protein
LKNIDLFPKDYSTGGHTLLLPKGRRLLEQFEIVKCGFTGTGQAVINLPRGVAANDEYAESIVNGVITLTE